MAYEVTATSFVVRDIIVPTRAFFVTMGGGRQDYLWARGVEDKEKGGTAPTTAR